MEKIFICINHLNLRVEVKDIITPTNHKEIMTFCRSKKLNITTKNKVISYIKKVTKNLPENWNSFQKTLTDNFTGFEVSNTKGNVFYISGCNIIFRNNSMINIYFDKNKKVYNYIEKIIAKKNYSIFRYYSEIIMISGRRTKSKVI